ncbi:MAG: hypothetical protein ACRCTD_02545 [Beijerinckiaceae bacterium]
MFLAVVFSLLIPAAKPARASDVLDCIAGVAKATYGVAELEAAAAFFSHAENIPCIGMLADPSGQFQAITAALVVMKAGGVFSSVDQCKNMGITLAVKIVIAVADKLGIDIPPETRADVAKLAEWVQQEALGQTILQELGCGCAVAVYGIEGLEKSLDNLKSTAESCGAVLSDIAGAIVDAAKEIGKGLSQAANDFVDGVKSVWELATDTGDLPSTPPPPPVVLACTEPLPARCVYPDPNNQGDKVCYDAVDSANAHCASGEQCGPSSAWIAWHNATPLGKMNPKKPTDWRTWRACTPCSAVPNGIGAGEDTCGCKNGYQPVYQTGPSNKKTLLSCMCPSPLQEGFYFGGEKSCQCPIFGTTVQRINGQFVCACPAGQQLDSGLCRFCNANETYDAASRTCVACGPGRKADAAHASCLPACNDGQIFDAATKSCKSCPSGSIAVHPVSGSSVGDCRRCPPGQISFNGRECGCPVHQHLRDGKCVDGPGVIDKPVIPPIVVPRVPPQKTIVWRDCRALGANVINNPRDPSRCIRCARGFVANEQRTLCIRGAFRPQDVPMRPVLPPAGPVRTGPPRVPPHLTAPPRAPVIRVPPRQPILRAKPARPAQRVPPRIRQQEFVR